MMLLTPVTNWEPHGVTLAGYCYAKRHGIRVQIVTPYRVSHLLRYGVTVRGNVTSVYPRLQSQGVLVNHSSNHTPSYPRGPKSPITTLSESNTSQRMNCGNTICTGGQTVEHLVVALRYEKKGRGFL
jgi:hypothetical protein